MTKFNQMRLRLIFFCVLGLTTILSLRLFQIQILDIGDYSYRAFYQRLKLDSIPPERGDILDRNGKILAKSIPTPAVYADPSLIEDPDSTAKALATIIEKSVDEIYNLITGTGNFVWLTRRLSIEKRSELENLKIKGIRIISLPRRYYPEGSLAASTIGIAGIDNQGLEGIEVTYERYLAGEPGINQMEKDPRGREIPAGFTKKSLPKNGVDLYLTIDAGIQHIAEREITKAVIDTNARQGILLAMDPKNGEILALAEYPGFDPNDFSKAPLSVRKNKAITESFEPGSTFKIFIAAAAVEEGIINPGSQVYDPPVYKVGDIAVRCSTYGGHGYETFLESLERSCNPVFAKLAAEDMDTALLYKYLKAFGFGDRTGVDFIGEAKGIFAAQSDLSQVSWANIGFGQGIAVTPLQLVTATCAIANGGYLPKPILVRSYKENGKLINKGGEDLGKQVISESTAETLKMMMRSAVVNGSGKRAEIEGFSVAGKTGTAQVPEGGRYSDTKTVVSFLGFAPIDDPQIVALVAIFEPDTDRNLGGVLAAPVFKEFTTAALQYTGVKTRVQKGGTIAVPDLIGKKRDEAIKDLAKLGLKANIKGESSTVSGQDPLPGFLVNENTTVSVICAMLASQETPRFIGMDLDQAQALALSRGIQLKTKGNDHINGIVASQKPVPGQTLGDGDAVELTFISR